MPKKDLRQIVTDTAREILNKIAHPKNKEEVTLVIPAYNEEKTISKVIKEAQKVKEISQIIVIDDGSKDKTAKIAKSLGVEIISHHENLGKGEAIKTGIAHAKGTILGFVDADWKNIEANTIRSILMPLIKDKADFVKGSFELARGRVTEFAVKPMMKLLYPKEIEFKQPISGQFAGKKEFLKELKIESKWGIDIGIFLDAIKQGQKVVEVNLGEILHKGQTTEEKAEMSGQVIETMLKKAGHLADKHKVIIFTDNTIINNKKSVSENNQKIIRKLQNKKIPVILISTRILPKETRDLFNETRTISQNETPKKITKLLKRLAKKYSATPIQTLLVINKKMFTNSTAIFENCYCLKNSCQQIKNSCKQIESIAEILVYLE